MDAGTAIYYLSALFNTPAVSTLLTLDSNPSEWVNLSGPTWTTYNIQWSKTDLTKGPHTLVVSPGLSPSGQNATWGEVDGFMYVCPFILLSISEHRSITQGEDDPITSSMSATPTSITSSSASSISLSVSSTFSASSIPFSASSTSSSASTASSSTPSISSSASPSLPTQSGSSQTSPPSSVPEHSTIKTAPVGAIVGIVLGLFLLLILGFTILCQWKKRKVHERGNVTPDSVSFFQISFVHFNLTGSSTR